MVTQPGRNDPCPCGSGKKYKQCCGKSAPTTPVTGHGEPSLSHALTAFNRGDYRKALEEALLVLKNQSGNADAYHLCGLALFSLGQMSSARGHLEQACRLAPTNPLMHSNFGRILEHCSDYEAAEQSCRRALAIDPTLADAHHNLANILKNLGQYDQALHHYRESVRLAPDVAPYRNNLGITLMARDEMEEARNQFEQAIKLDPSFAPAHGNLGTVYLKSGDFESACTAFKSALRLNPNYPEALANLGLALHRRREYPEAIELYRRAMEMDSRMREIYSSNLITALEDNSDLDGANKVAKDVLENVSARPGSLIAAITNFGKTCDFARRKEAEAIRYRLVLANKLPASHLLSCNYSDFLTPEEIFSLHCLWSRQLKLSGSDIFQEKSLSPELGNRRLRIGYLSPDLRDHAVGYFIKPIIAHHDVDSFEIYGYYNNRKEDTITDKIRSHCHQFINISRLSDEELRAQIRSDEIDILVDLAGHTEGSRLQMMASRAAPVQVSYLGYSNTTGLETIDYIIVDKNIFESCLSFHTEIPAVLPECFVTFDPPCLLTGNIRSPVEKNGYITFGSLNNLMKLTAHSISCWSKVLIQIPDARLLIGYKGADAKCTRQNLEQEFSRNGISPDRLVFFGRQLKREDFLALYNQIDLFLDTFPYTGTTTTCEALLQNVPVITKTGMSQRERVSASILQHVGLLQLIADSESEYVEIAVRLARDTSTLQEIRRELPGLLSKSVICQPMRLVRALEALYRGMWDRYLRKDTSRVPLTISNSD